MKFTIIIPTMWKCTPFLKEMVIRYDACDLVEEILIINNDEKARIELESNKVRILGTGDNMFVNPAWNLGVKEAKTEMVVLANDDIYFNTPCSLFRMLYSFLPKGFVAGFDSSCFTRTIPNDFYGLVKTDSKKLPYGFGFFMVLLKEDYKPIPKELKVWFGDTYLYRDLTSCLIKGLPVIAKRGTTSKTMDLKDQHRIEKTYFEKLVKNGK